MTVNKPKLPVFLAALAAVASCTVAITGMLNLDLYRSTVLPRFMPGTISQDIGAVVVSAIILAMSLPLMGGKSQYWPIWLGAVGYLAYGYAIFAFEAVLTPMYAAYLMILALSIWAVIAFFARLDPDRSALAGPPRKLTAALFVALSLLFLGLWSSILFPAIAAGTRPDGLTIFVLDLCFVLPLLTYTGTLLWKGAPLGDVLAIPLLIKAGSIGLSVLLGTLISPFFGLRINPEEVVIYAFLGFGPLALIVPWMRAFARQRHKSADRELAGDSGA